jgi:hypothetical protein
MKKHFIPLLLLGSTLCGCKLWHVIPEMSLKSVMVNERVLTTAIVGNTFENENVSFSITNTSSVFNITVQNKKAEALFIVWDESAIIYPNGESAKIVPENTKFIDAEKSVVSTPVPPYSNVRYAVCSLNQVHWLPGSPATRRSSTWTVSGFFPLASPSKEKALERYKNMEGQEMKVYLQLKNNVNERTGYFFTFNIDRIKPV